MEIHYQTLNHFWKTLVHFCLVADNPLLNFYICRADGSQHDGQSLSHLLSQVLCFKLSLLIHSLALNELIVLFFFKNVLYSSKGFAKSHERPVHVVQQWKNCFSMWNTLIAILATHSEMNSSLSNYVNIPIETNVNSFLGSITVAVVVALSEWALRYLLILQARRALLFPSFARGTYLKGKEYFFCRWEVHLLKVKFLWSSLFLENLILPLGFLSRNLCTNLRTNQL